MKLSTTERLLTKSQKEFQAEVWHTLKILILKNGYLKGYGKQDRLMSEDHSPIKNIDRKITDCLKFNELLSPDGLIQRLSLKAHTVTLQDQIKLNL